MAYETGVAVLGWVGYTATATGIGAIVAGIVGGAIIGAAVGGLTSAVMGGDIGKGVLYGAIGGAVLGGIGAWADMGTSTAGSGVGSAGSGYDGIGAVGNTSNGAYSATLGTEASGSLGASGGGVGGAEGSTTAGFLQSAAPSIVTTAGSMLAKGFDTSAEDAAKEAEKQRKWQSEEAAKQREMQMAIAEMSGGGSSNGDARYSADIQLQNAREQRAQDYKIKQEEYSAIEDVRARREASAKGLLAGNEAGAAPVAPGIDQQVYTNSNLMYAQNQPTQIQNINQTQQPGVMKEQVYA